MTAIFRRILSLLSLAALSAAFAMPAAAQQATPEPSMAAGRTDASEPEPDGAFLVATRAAPPFAMKDKRGRWSGIAIELWRSVADENDYDYRFVEVPLADMIDGVADGRYGAAVGALTITPEREKRVDFTHPFHATGFGIAVGSGPPSWLNLLSAMVSFDFLKIVAIISGMLLVVGVLFWLTERRTNAEEFPEEAGRGIGAGFWFSAVTMTTVGYGDKAPRSVGGRIVALVWMFLALFLTSIFTGLVASTLTAGRLGGGVSGPGDLSGNDVAAIRDSAGQEWLSRDGISSEAFDTLPAALDALVDGDVDAVVHDHPLLRYSVNGGYGDDIKVLPGSFGRQDYALALPPGSERREEINLAILRHIDTDRWIGQMTQALDNEN